MISGVKTRELARRGVLALGLAVAVAPAWAAFDLAALMALLAQQRGGEAEFTELRHVRGLDEPLASSGTLSFTAPDRFVRRTLKPRAETLAVEGNAVTMTRGGRSRSFALDAAPEVGGLVEAIRGTLTGDAQTLQKHFRTELGGRAELWTLALVPKEPRLGAQLRAIRIDGRRGEVRSIELQLVDGDRSVMTVEPLRPTSAAAP